MFYLWDCRVHVYECAIITVVVCVRKRVNSHNVIDIQADVVHQRMSNLSYSVERG